MSLIKAFRMNGLGNKFIIVDRRINPVNISKEKIRLKILIIDKIKKGLAGFSFQITIKNIGNRI